MFRKWYIELPIILAVISIAVAIVWRTQIPAGCGVVDIQVPQPSSAQKQMHSTVADSTRQKYTQGKSIFKSNCAACHNPKVDGTGPALQNVEERWKAAGDYKGKSGEEWLKVWIRNWREPVEAGYPYAVAMANSRATEMNMFPNLSDRQIEDLLFYTNQPALLVVQSSVPQPGK